MPLAIACWSMAGELTYGVVYGIPQVTPFIPPMRVMQTIVRKATPRMW